MSITRVGREKLYSRATIHNGLVYLMGHVADDRRADVKVQTQQILNRIDETLAMAGSDKTKLLMMNVWLRDPGDYVAMNEVWATWVVAGHEPARQTVGVELVSEGRRVVISGIATL